MNNYSDWSDFDINEEIAKRENLNPPKAIDSWCKKMGNVWFEDSVDGLSPCTYWPDYCNNGEQTARLMQKHKIGLIPIRDKWLASPCVLTAMDFDDPEHGLVQQAQSDNPCRAVAECFILIGDEDEEA